MQFPEPYSVVGELTPRSNSKRKRQQASKPTMAWQLSVTRAIFKRFLLGGPRTATSTAFCDCPSDRREWAAEDRSLGCQFLLKQYD